MKKKFDSSWLELTWVDSSWLELTLVDSSWLELTQVNSSWLELTQVDSSWLNLSQLKWVHELIRVNSTQMNPWMNSKQKLFWIAVHFQRLFKGPGISEISFLKKAMYGFFLWSIYCLQHHNMTGIDCRKKYHPWSLQGNINYIGK